MERWVINIDIEGFSLLWDREDQVLRSLGELMRAIFRIGRECFPHSPERIFAHQLGDGFVIVSDFEEANLERAVTVAVALMQHVASSGRLAKAAIAEGELSDIQGCYPREVLNELESDQTVSLHMGLMTIFPVMGTALIRAVKVAKMSPSGPLLLIEHSKANRVSGEIPIKPVIGTELAAIDWVHMKTPQLSRIQECARLRSPKAVEMEDMLRNYCAQFPLKKEWVDGVREYLGVNSV